MTSDKRRFLIFSLQTTLYALDLRQVAEVDDPPRMWPIPLAPACYCGALNFHGDIFAVMNLGLFLGLATTKLSGKVIVLNQDVASLAFLVDSVIGIVSEEEVSICKPPESSFATALLKLADAEAIQLDLEALVLSAESGMKKTSDINKYPKHENNS